MLIMIHKLIIVAAAIKVKDVTVSLPAPNRHHHIIHKIFEYGWLTDEIRKNDLAEQGFIDSSGHFRSREEAFKIADEAGQIITGSTRGYLFSEDLW